jgi:hypothetical protein
MAAEHDETNELSGELDPIALAICPLLEHIFAVTADGSSERQRALTEMLTVVEKVRAALQPQPRLK